MAAAYGKDLREKVLKASDKGIETDVQLAKMMDISDRSIRRWRQKERETGTIEAKVGYQKGNPKIKNLDEFKKFVQENPSLTQREMAKILNVSQPSIYRAMKKINFTVKKNNMVIKSVMKKSEKYL
jgi:transposase